MYHNLFPDNPRRQSALADSTTVFGDIIRQVAEGFFLGEYNGKGLIEYTKDNTDEWIKKLWTCYQGSVPTGNEFARSYCAVGAWLTIQTAANIAQCANQFPKGLGGNVYNTYYKIKTQTSIPVNSTPAVGSVFVRESLHSGNNHMGIVTSVNESGTVIQAIEWNAGLDQVGASTNKTKVYGGVSHVAYYPERYNQFKNWSFIHFEEMCNIATLPCGTYADPCFGISIEIEGCEQKTVTTDVPDVVKKTDTTVCENITCPPGYRKLTAKDIAARGAVAIGSKKGSAEYYTEYCCVPNTTTVNGNTKNPKPCPTIIKQGCDTGSIKVNYPDNVPHFTQVSSDQYWKWCMPDLVDNQAIKLLKDKGKIPSETFPVVRDNNGNTFIILTPNSTMHELVRKYKLDGGSKAVNIVFNVGKKIESYTHGTDALVFASTMADLFLKPGDKPKNPDVDNWGNTKEFKDEFPRYNNGQTPKNMGLPDFLSGTQSFYGAMELIEREGKKYDKTFVFVGIGTQQSDNGIIDGALRAAAPIIIGATLTAIGAPQLAAEFNKFYNVLQNFSANPGNIGNIFALAGAVLPDQYGTYLTKAQTIANAVQNLNLQNANGAVQAAKAIAQELNGGKMPEWIQWGDKQVNGLYSFAQNQWRSVSDFVNATDEQVAKTVQSYSNYATALLTGGIGDIESGWNTVLTNLVSSGKDVFSDSGVNGQVGLQNIFTTSTKGAALALLPNAQQLIGGILSNSVLSVKTVSDVAEHAALMAIATGKKYTDEQVRGFQLKSLLNKAEEAVRNNVPFALPAIWSFPEDDKDGKVTKKEYKDIGDCFAREIEVCLNINVCRAPKTMVNGICTTPGKTTTVTTNNNGGKVNTNGNINLTPEEFPVDVQLPNCIVPLGQDRQYFYCPDTKCDSMLWRKLNVGSPNVPVVPDVPTNPTNPTNPTFNNTPVMRNGSANGGTGYDGTSTNYSGIPQGILPPVQGNEDQQAYYNAMNNGDYGAPQLNDPNCNTLYPAIYNKGQWYAQINGKYVVITDCCPTEMPTVTNDCCDATQKNIQALAGQITKLQELVLRNSAGEKTQAVDLSSVMNELSAIHALVDSMRNQKPNEIKQLDITPLQKQINDLQTAVSNIKVTVPQGNGQVVQQYNDSGLRQQIAELRSLITQTKSDSERPYSAELQLIQNNLVQLKSAYDRNLQMLLNEIRTQVNSPLLQTDYNRLLNEKNAQVAEYQKRIQELQDRIATQGNTQTTTNSGTTNATTNTGTKPSYTPTNPSYPTEPPRTVPTRTYDTNGNCTNCPVLEETHTRRIYQYPQQPPQTNCDSDDC